MSNFVLDLFNRSVGAARVAVDQPVLAGDMLPGPRTVKNPRVNHNGDHREPAQPTRKESIVLTSVFRSYANSRGSFTPALQNIDLEIEQGEFVAAERRAGWRDDGGGRARSLCEDRLQERAAPGARRTHHEHPHRGGVDMHRHHLVAADPEHDPPGFGGQ